MNSHKTTKFVSFLARKFPAIQYKSDVLNPESICNQSGVLSSLDRWQLLTAISSPLFVKIVSMLLCYVVMYIHSTCRPSNLPQRKQPCINCAMWFNRTSVPSDPSKNMNAAEDFLLLLSHTHVAAAKNLQSANTDFSFRSCQCNCRQLCAFAINHLITSTSYVWRRCSSVCSWSLDS